MQIPTYSLAVALAEEWASQPWNNGSQYLNMRSMRLNTIFARAARTAMDFELREFQEKTILDILGMDQV